MIIQHTYESLKNMDVDAENQILVSATREDRLVLKKAFQSLVTDECLKITGDGRENPVLILERKEVREALKEALAALTEREKTVVISRNQEKTLDDIGASLGLKGETIRKIEIRAMKKLRRVAQNPQSRLAAFSDCSL